MMSSFVLRVCPGAFFFCFIFFYLNKIMTKTVEFLNDNVKVIPFSELDSFSKKENSYYFIKDTKSKAITFINSPLGENRIKLPASLSVASSISLRTHKTEANLKPSEYIKLKYNDYFIADSLEVFNEFINKTRVQQPDTLTDEKIDE